LLVGLTGIGPLIAWRKDSPENLRRQFTVALATGAVFGVVLLLLVIRDLYAVMAWALAGFVLGTVTQEFWRGIRARRRMHGESAPGPPRRLTSRHPLPAARY